MLPVLNSLTAAMAAHLKIKNIPGMTKAEMRKIAKVRAKRNGIIIVHRINIKTLLKMGRVSQIRVISRRLSENFRDTSEKMDCKLEYTSCH